MKKTKSPKSKNLIVRNDEAGEKKDGSSGEVLELRPRGPENRLEFEDNDNSPEFKRFKASESDAAWRKAHMDENTVLIKRTVRCGQLIQFDGNVVVMGDVNPGAEIISSGSIMVMGALRGIVHAGAKGNEEATVSAFKLQPTQLRIANHITRAPDGEYPSPDHPETARIKDGVVVIEMYQLAQDRQIKIS